MLALLAPDHDGALKVAQIADEAFDVHPNFQWVDLAGVTPSPDHGWTAVQTDGVWAFAPPQPPSLVEQALTALAATDGVPRRAFEDGVVYPGAWKTYRNALRDIVAGREAPDALPEQPPYPS
jgi:hypothetical protein